MIVCHCEVVSDRDVRTAIAAGAHDVDAVTDTCGAAGRCGGCVPAVENLLAEAALAARDLGALLTAQAARRTAVAA